MNIRLMFLVAISFSGVFCLGNGTLKGKPAPDFVVRSESGTARTLSSFRGKFIVLDIFSDYCLPCNVMLHDLEVLGSKSPPQVTFLAVFEGTEKSLLRWKTEHGPHPHVDFVCDPNWKSPSECARAKYLDQAIPSIHIIDPKGIYIEGAWQDEKNEIENLERVLAYYNVAPSDFAYKFPTWYPHFSNQLTHSSFRVRDVTDQDFDLPRTDRPYTMITFWATWSPDSSEAIKLALKACEAMPGRVEFYGVCVWSDATSFHDWYNSHSCLRTTLYYQVDFDHVGSTPTGVPCTVLIDRGGKVLGYADPLDLASVNGLLQRVTHT